MGYRASSRLRTFRRSSSGRRVSDPKLSPPGPARLSSVPNSNLRNPPSQTLRRDRSRLSQSDSTELADLSSTASATEEVLRRDRSCPICDLTFCFIFVAFVLTPLANRLISRGFCIPSFLCAFASLREILASWLRLRRFVILL